MGPEGSPDVTVRILADQEGRYYLVPDAVAEDLRVPDAAQDRIREVVEAAGDVQGYTYGATGAIQYGSVNGLVQHVLREGYLQNTMDLTFYAQKVSYYNTLKDRIRDEVAQMRAYTG